MPFDIDPLHAFYACAALAAALAAEAIYLLFHNANAYRTRVNRRLDIAGRETDRERVLVQLRRERGLTAEGGYRLPLAALNRLIVQSGVKADPTRGALAVIGLGFSVFAAVFFWRDSALTAVAAGIAAAAVLPLAALAFLRKRRRGAFGAQFPEAIDIIVRSLRAGHPIPIAISMVGRELPDPVGTEFGIVADEISYGADLEGAMRGMMARTGQEDLPLFVTSVAIQASTGGNLGQILENLSKVIRERFKTRRKIRGLSAEGRVSAMILNAVPFTVFGLINLTAPDFYGEAWDHPITPWFFAGALGWMFIGNLIMRRMINFRF
ncbi:MAG: Flp pilus assembly protein TadB [uncultured Microvirga sp.]|uniref:Flp pilus assembly protein TadB n=1 Tax=uncultured Microvirga sp. TaxID=412392 RepID=A0A6J4MNS9_9HYPH|nr:MAG: Flp pilus assembly protein TadB [uncultured Microvirga sp.]